MPVTWGIHKVDPEVDFVADGVIAIGWKSDGDIRALGRRRDDIRARLLQNHPDDNPNAIPIWAGMLYRFAYEIEIGDFVVHPDKSDRTVNIGRVVGDYEWHPDALALPSRRRVEWLKVGVPRTDISRAARNEIGSALTLFRVRRHEAEFLDLIGSFGGYARDAMALARTRPELRLVSGTDLADLVLDNYDRLPPNRQRLLPLKRLWVVDDATAVQ